MKTLITILLTYLAVRSTATPIASHGSSNSAGFINFREFLLPGIHSWLSKPGSPSPAKRDTSTEVPTEGFSGGDRDPVDISHILFDSPPPVRDRDVAMSSRRDEGSGDGLIFPGANTPSSRVPEESTLPRDEGSGDFVFPEHVSLKETVIPNDTVVHICTLENGGIMVNGTCLRLLTQGPCAEDEWLILKDNRTECVTRPCPFGELQFDGRCLNTTDVSVCDQGQILYVDFTGFTMCDCETGFIYDTWSGNCYAQHEKGPCTFGQYLEVSDLGAVECVRNECIMDGFVRDKNFSGCFRKMYRGFCEQQYLIIHRVNNTAECSAVDIRNIFDVATLRACPPGSIRDFLNECKEEFRLPTVTSFPTKYGDCPDGFIKDPRGTCRRVHRLLG